jgi:DNA phosphorothioation-associated putative methyltransferase
MNQSVGTQKIGKRILDEIYVHREAVHLVEFPHFQDLFQTALELATDVQVQKFNVIKVNVKKQRVSLLHYLDFDLDPFPTLQESWSYSHERKTITYRDFSKSFNPPILHRKELLVGHLHKSFENWSQLTAQSESIGLFETPNVIGFKENWAKLIFEKGFKLEAGNFLPLGNDDVDTADSTKSNSEIGIQRHLTALNRVNLSAPIQLLIRLGLLDKETVVFDYGCGRGDDIAGLNEIGIQCTGWDPHYASENSITNADVVNLGFVVNVIEDPAERVEAIHKAFSLTKGVLAISVMLHSSERTGKPYRDGYITSRNTFQKYFAQDEFKNYIEQILSRDAFMVGPGIALVFASEDAEQKFVFQRLRRRDVAKRLIYARQPKLRVRKRSQFQEKPPRLTKLEREFQQVKPALDQLWEQSLDLGRIPDVDEVNSLEELQNQCRTFSRAKRLLRIHYEFSLLEAAAVTRSDEIRLFFALQQFSQRAPYRQLELRLQRDVKYFFGDYKSAQAAGFLLLKESADTKEILKACKAAESNGIGWLEDEHSLQLHVSLVPRLPAILRAYVSCGLLLWENISEIDLVKIHIESGKLTLLQYQDFDTSPIPLLLKRVKVNLRKLDYDLYEYGSEKYPSPPLYYKSRYLHEDMHDYASQEQFDNQLEALIATVNETVFPSLQSLESALNMQRLLIKNFELVPSNSLPELDQLCGLNFTYRNFIHCGTTQARLGIANLPLNPETYNAYNRLARNVIDPLIDYFGGIRLTYGFCSAMLASKITERIAPKLDQHAGHELNRVGKPICERLGAAVDFIVDDEDMAEVAQWIVENTDFDRIYLYGRNKPLHVSYSKTPAKQVTLMLASASGRLTPRTLTNNNSICELIPK